MKPEYYDTSRYLEIYDLFSSLDNSIWSKTSLNILDNEYKVKIINKKQIYIADIGAGTGFYSFYFIEKNKKNWKNIFYTFVEPSLSMRKVLKKKIKDFSNSFVLPYDIDEALNYIRQQDIFIFQRSLYAFYIKEEFYKYRILIKKLYDKLNFNGIVIIGEIYTKYDIDIFDKRVKENYYKTSLSNKEETIALSILRKTLLDFNYQIDIGNLIMFKKNELINLFLENNFILEKEIHSFLVFKKK